MRDLEKKRESDRLYRLRKAEEIKAAKRAWYEANRDRAEIYKEALGESIHIVPFKNPLVCGLHNEHNLRPVFAHVNHRKYNKFEVV